MLVVPDSWVNTIKLCKTSVAEIHRLLTNRGCWAKHPEWLKLQHFENFNILRI
jgi:hypothetical protein